MKMIKYNPKRWALTSEEMLALEGNYMGVFNKMEAAVYRALLSVSDLLQKYDELVLFFPKHQSY